MHSTNLIVEGLRPASVEPSTSLLTHTNHNHRPIASNTCCLLRLVWLFPLFRLLDSLLLHLLSAHIMAFVPDYLLTIAGELRLPLSFAGLRP